MPVTLQQLMNVCSRFAEEVDSFCAAAVAALDTTSFHFKDNDAGTSRAISISGTALDARVFTKRLKADEDSLRQRGPQDGAARGGDDGPPRPTAHDKAVAELNERPWETERRESIPWSRAVRRAQQQRPLVIRGAPGAGKTTLSRASAITRLQAVRAAVAQHTRLPEECEPMLWMTCAALAQVSGSASVPADLVIAAAFHAMNLPEQHRGRSVRVQDWLRACIAAGRCPVVLDSLDEVRLEEEQAFRARAPLLLHLGSPVVLTCRVLEWEQRQSWTGWREVELVELAPFTQREQRDYAKKFFQKEINRPNLLTGFERQLAQNLSLRKACESPILLFFACLLHAEGELGGATRRTELYQLMRRRLFRGEWRGLPQPPEWVDGDKRERRVTAWFGEIALALFQAAPEAKAFSLDAWDAACDAPKAQAAAAKVVPSVQPDELLDDLERCGFVVKAGWQDDQPHYSFLHRSFLAFLAGAALAQRAREVWLKEVIGHLWFQPAWEDVILFLTGHLDEEDTDALLEALEEQSEDIFRQRLRWQWRVAGEVKAISTKWGERWMEPAKKLAQSSDHQSHGSSARDQLMNALGAAERTAPEVRSSLRRLLDPAVTKNRDLRRAVATALAKTGAHAAESALVASLEKQGDPAPIVRVTIASLLGQFSGKTSLDCLLRRMDRAVEDDSLVREKIALSLGQRGGDEARSALLGHLDPNDEADSGVRGSVIDALGSIDSEASRRALDGILSTNVDSTERDRNLRARAAEALGKIGDEQVTRTLAARLSADEDVDVRASAAIGLGRIGGQPALEALLPHLERNAEPDGMVRAQVAAALGRIGGQPALEALLPHLDRNAEPDGMVRAQVAAALGRIGGQPALEALLPHLDRNAEPDGMVRAQVAAALGRIGGQPALEALLPHLDRNAEPDVMVRAQVAAALGHIGGDHALATLLPHLDGGVEFDEEVRCAVAEALGRIGGSRACDELLACQIKVQPDPWRLALSVTRALHSVYWRMGNREKFLECAELK